MHESIFEMWCKNKLPEQIQTKVNNFAEQGKSYEERVFRAGFYLNKYIKEIREELGIEE